MSYEATRGAPGSNSYTGYLFPLLHDDDDRDHRSEDANETIFN